MATIRYAGDRFVGNVGSPNSDATLTGVLDGAYYINTGNLTQYVKRPVGGWAQLAGGGGGGGTPGGANTQVQFNNAGTFGGDADLTFTDGNRLNVNKLGISGNIYDSNDSLGEGGMVLTNEGQTGVNWKSIESVLSGVGGSGVANYVARWSDEDTITTGVLVDNGTNVGVGATNPAFKLQVQTPAVPTNSTYVVGFDVTRPNSANRGFTVGSNSAADTWTLGAHNADIQLGHTFGTDTGGQPAFYPDITIKHSDESVGSVGIGTASPSSLLHVYGADPVLTIQDSESTVASASAILRIGESDGSANLNNNFNIKFVGTASGGDLDISRYNSTTLANQGIRIKHDGNVGIGTASPAADLEVSTASGGELLVDNYGSSGVALQQRNGGATNSGSFKLSGGTLINFFTNDTENVRINSDGNVGIGTTGPWEKLAVYGGGINFGSAPSADNSGKLTYNTTSGQLKISAHSTGGNTYQTFTVSSSGSQVDAVTIKSDGNVGIGTTSPVGILHASDVSDFYLDLDGTDSAIVFKEGGGNSWRIGNRASGDKFNITQNATSLGSDVRFTIANGGNVGIGSTVPAFNLDVTGTGRYTGLLNLNGGIYFQRESAISYGTYLKGSSFQFPQSPDAYYSLGKYVMNTATYSYDTLTGYVVVGYGTPNTSNSFAKINFTVYFRNNNSLATGSPHVTWDYDVEGEIDFKSYPPFRVSKTQDINNGAKTYELQFSVSQNYGTAHWLVSSSNVNTTSNTLTIFDTALGIGTAISDSQVKQKGFQSYMGSVGIGTIEPYHAFHVSGDAIISGKLYDAINSTGDKGYVLTSDDDGPIWAASGDFDGLSGNLVATGAIVDDISGNLITSGQTLTTNINTVANNLITTGQTLTSDINALAGNVGVTGQTLQTQITNNDTDIATNAANLITTGQTLTNDLISTGNFLESEIAIVSGLVSGDPEIVGTGTVGFIPKFDDENSITDSIIKEDSSKIGIGVSDPQHLLHIGGDAIVSGKFYDSVNSTGDKGYVLTSDDTGPVWAASGDFDTLSGNLITTGQTLQTQITSNDSDISTLTSNLVTTGQTLTTNINTVSSNLVSTGSVVDDISGNLITTGQTLQTQITANDSDIAANTANLITTGQTLQTQITANDGDISTLTSNLITTGQTLTSDINALAGNVGVTGQTLQTQITSNDTDIAANTANLITTGQTLQTQITSNDGDITNLTANLITTGQTLQTQITANDGDISTLTTNLITTGQTLTSDINALAGNVGITGQTLQTQITSNDTEIATLTSNLVTTGQTLTTNINTVSANLISTGSVVDDISGNLITTGQTLTSDINALAGNVGVTGQTLQTQIDTNASNLISTGNFLESEIAIVSGLVSGDPEIVGTGTSGYLPKFDDENSITDSVISQSGSNIGINITDANPATELHIGSTGAPSQGENWASLSIGEDNLPERRIQINAYRSLRGSDWDHMGISFQPHTSANHLVGPTITGMAIDYDGHVGIGITAPSEKLHVDGAGYFEGGGLRDGSWHRGIEITTENANFSSLFFGGQSTTKYSAIIWTSSTSGNVNNKRGAQIVAHPSSAANTDLKFSTNNAVGTSDPSVKMVIRGDGKVGIGTDGPATNLDVYGSSAALRISGSGGTSPQLELSSVGAVNWKLRANISSSDFRITKDSTDYLTILSGGSVGIGTVSPSTKLHVVGSGTDDGIKVLSGTNVYLELDSTDAATTREVATKYKNFSTGTNFWWTGLNQSGAYDIAYGTTFTNANTKLRVQTDGNVGIGTVSPSTYLDVEFSDTTSYASGNGNSRGLDITNAATDNNTQFASLQLATLNNTNGTGSLVRIHAINENSTAGASSMAFTTRNASSTISEKMRIKGDGNVGIGTASPFGQLHLSSTESNVQRLIFSNSNSNLTPQQRIEFWETEGTGTSTNANAAIEYDGGGTYESSNGTLLIRGYGSSANLPIAGFNRNGNVYFGMSGTKRVGVGTNAPVKDIDLKYSSNNSADLAGSGLAGGAAGNGILINNTASNVSSYANLDFRAHNADGRIAFRYDAANKGSFHFINDNDSGGFVNTMSIMADGEITFGSYGSGTHTGTAAYRLMVDSSGNVIEGNLGAGVVDGSGTANKVAKWTDTDTIGDSQITDNGTSVGINVSPNAANKLEVNGQARATTGMFGNSSVSNVAAKPIHIKYGGTAELRLEDSTSSNYVYDISCDFTNGFRITDVTSSLVPFTIEKTTGNVGIGTTSPTTPLHVVGNTVINGVLYFDSTSNSFINRDSSNIRIAGENGVKLQTYVSGWQDRLVIADDGDIDIAQRLGVGGTHSNSYQLYVTGNSYFSSAITTGGQLRGTLNSSITSIENFILDTKGEDAPVINHQLNNDLALLRVKGNTVTYSGLSSNPGDTETDRFFEANSYFGDVAATEISNASTGFTITLDSLPRNLTYTTRVGISFASPSWRCSYVKIEVYRAGAWTQIIEETSNSSATVYKYYNTGSSAITKIRYTLKTPVTTSLRIVSLFAFNYNSTGATGYYLSQAGGTIYGDLTIGSSASDTTTVLSSLILDETAYPSSNSVQLGYTSNRFGYVYSEVGSFSSNVGIGTDSPVGKLHIYGSGSPQFRIQDSTNDCILKAYAQDSNAFFGTHSNHDLNIGANNDTHITVEAGGNIGIGTTAPDGRLHVHTASAGSVTAPTAADDLVIENSAACGITIISPDANDGGLYFANPSDAEAACLRWNHNADTLILETRNAGASLVFETANTVEAMRINSSGLVGIGTNDPVYTLQGNGTNGGIIGVTRTAGNTTGVLGHIRFGNTDIDSDLANIEGIQDGATDSARLEFQTQATGAAAATHMTIKSSGSVGIGTTAPLAKLHVEGGPVRIIDSTALPSYGARLIVGRDTDQDLEFIVDDLNCKIVADQDSDTNGSHSFILNREFAGSGANDFRIQKSGSSQLLINTDGNVGIGTISPGAKLDVRGDIIRDDLYYNSWVSRSINSITSGSSTINYILIAPKATTNVRLSGRFNCVRGTGVSAVSIAHADIVFCTDNDANPQSGGIHSAASDIPGYGHANFEIVELVYTSGNVGTEYYALKISPSDSWVASFNQIEFEGISNNITWTNVDSGNVGNVGAFGGSEAVFAYEHANVHIATAQDSVAPLTLKSTYNGSTAGPLLDLYRKSGTPSDGDNLGTLTFTADTNVGSINEFARIESTALDVTDTTEDGALKLAVVTAGTLRSRVYMDSTETVFNDASQDFDFRVESDNSSHALFVRGSDSAVGVGTAAPNAGSWSNAVTIQGASSAALELMKGGSLYGFMGVQGSGSSHALDIAAYQNQSIRLRVGSNAGTTAVTILNTGQVQLNSYGSGTHTGTAAYRLLVDSSGNVIEGNLGAGVVDGSGTANYITKWTDTDTIGNSIIQDDGNVGIGTTGNGYKLRVQGNVYISGTLTEASSLVIKENIETFEPSLDIINKIRPVKYDKKTTGKKEIGLIAEELAELFPELVEKDKNGNPSGVNYSRAVTVLLGGFKELYKEVQELKKRI